VSPAEGRSVRIALLANPRSGDGDAPDVEPELRALGADVERLPIGEHEKVTGTRADRLVVAGGDGSIAAAAAAAARESIPLAVVAVGTANDFARAFELPDDVRDACRLAVEGDRTRRLDLGRMGGVPFVNVASAGLAPVAAREAGGVKSSLGQLAYGLGALRAGLGASPLSCRVSCDGDEIFSGRAWQVTVACSGAFGAGSSIAADPADGLLDAVAIEATSRLSLLRRAYGLRAGRVESQRGVASGRGRRVSIEAAAGTPFNVDGELVDAGGGDFEVEPGAFALVVG
jgi:diacylglycerol kinase family enzyme